MKTHINNLIVEMSHTATGAIHVQVTRDGKLVHESRPATFGQLRLIWEKHFEPAVDDLWELWFSVKTASVTSPES